MTWRNEYEKSVLLFTQHCIIDAKIAVRFDAIFTALPFPFLLHSSFPVTFKPGYSEANTILYVLTMPL